jgi:Icc-related predicted phosphoesterase
MSKLVFISDTHLRHNFVVPEGDILCHTGDMTMQGSVQEMARAATWLKGLKVGHGFKAAVVICGNHDWLGERDPATTRLLFEEKGLIYLHDQAAEILGLRFYGSPYQPEFCDWAFNVRRGPELAAIWAKIPDDTQVLLTHGPPRGRLDVVHEADESKYNTLYGHPVRYIKKHVGCNDLAKRIAQLKDLKISASGHIHCGYGLEKGADGITYINSSICNESYQAVNKPIVIDL